RNRFSRIPCPGDSAQIQGARNHARTSGFGGTRTCGKNHARAHFSAIKNVSYEFLSFWIHSSDRPALRRGSSWKINPLARTGVTRRGRLFSQRSQAFSSGALSLFSQLKPKET